jgi:hypothetical protein
VRIELEAGGPRRNRTRVVAIVLVGLLAFLIVSAVSPPVAAAGPSLAIVLPTNGEVIGNGTPVVVTFAVANFVLVQPGRVGEIVSSTEGHLDVYVDGAYAELITRVTPISLPLESGPHNIRLQLVANDGSPLVPDVSASVNVTVTHGPAVGVPTIRIVSPVPGQRTGHDVYFAVQVTNFTLVDANGQSNAPNEGHVQFFLNGRFQQEPHANVDAFIVDLPDGRNTVTARLVNNDNSPLTPDVSASVTIFVKGAPDPTTSEELTAGITVGLGVILAVLIVRRRKAVARVAKEGTKEP